jgi:L-lactate dehydrogenase complex protein LldE
VQGSDQLKVKVGLFVTCLVDAVRPEIGFSTVRLLEAAGFEVVVPEWQTCCGQPAYNSGDSRTARVLAQKLLAEFESFDYLVVPSGSCGGQIKVQYIELFRDDPDLKARIERLADKTFELTDFIVNVAKCHLPASGFSGTITYHDSCSGLRELGVKRQPRQLLAMLPAVTLTEMKDCEQCCGFGGTFSVKYGDISGAIVDEKCQNIRGTGADAVVLGDLGCMLNIEGRLRRIGDEKTRVLHIAQVLAGDA